MPDTTPDPRPALTSRRSFVLGASLGIVSVYGVWAAYDAAPLGSRNGKAGGHDDAHARHGADRPERAAPDAGHAGHGAAPRDRATAIERFRREAEAFFDRYRQADGAVAVFPPSAAPGHEGHATSGALDAYMLAQRWSFEPATLKLARGRRYRFRMMAMDVAHGAAIQAGAGSVIVRLRPGIAVEREIEFRRAGRYLVYCTTYCGPPHDRMWATIVVV
jgi:heme/copper-type cytochrome/quinol oxidase subunit 2